MEIDLKHLKAVIAAEISRRDLERDNNDGLPGEDDVEVFSKRLRDAVRAFEPIELDGVLPQTVPEQAPATPASPMNTRAAGLFRQLRGTPLSRFLDHPRVLGLLDRARQLPGGATFGNVARLVVRAAVLRVPALRNFYAHLVSARHMPARVAELELKLAEATTSLRNFGQLLQDQTNQSLYTHALATQYNDEYLLRRVRFIEQRIRERFVPQAVVMGAPQQAELSPAPAAAADAGMPPDLYGAFEDRFRGARDLISERLRANLRFFQPLLGAPNRPVLDLGCGRGEWLQLLAERGVPAEGVDSNPWMVQNCTAAGLTVRQGDAIEYLAALPDNSLAGLTGFHIIEHLPLGVLIRLIEQARRVVQPGGIVLFETPNPENLIVGACNFYIDPTHRNPLPPALVAFLLEAYGFEHIEIERRHPADLARLDPNAQGALAEPLASLLFGPQDYAAIGYVPHEVAECT